MSLTLSEDLDATVPLPMAGAAASPHHDAQALGRTLHALTVQYCGFGGHHYDGNYAGGFCTVERRMNNVACAHNPDDRVRSILVSALDLLLAEGDMTPEEHAREIAIVHETRDHLVQLDLGAYHVFGMRSGHYPPVSDMDPLAVTGISNPTAMSAGDIHTFVRQKQRETVRPLIELIGRLRDYPRFSSIAESA